MTYFALRRRAIEMRRQGRSYRQIRLEIPVSKASLSLWLKDIPLIKIKVLLHLYQDMDIATQTSYWSDILDVPKEQFVKPYIKRVIE